MPNDRRSFLKLTGLAGIGVGTGGILKRFSGNRENDDTGLLLSPYKGSKIPEFNMCGYAAPKLETVRTGFIGLGQRGPAHLKNMSKLENVEINALCDLRPDKVQAAQKLLEGSSHHPTLYTGQTDAWKKLCERPDIDLVFIATPWDLHTPMALYAMKHGKHVCIEVPAAVTVDECWQLVETSEQTRKYCMMMENCCYDFFELLTLNMARQGFFGEIIHCEGSYIHHILEEIFNKHAYWDMWRLRQNAHRNGNLYPTHGLGPLCQIMNINRGEKMDHLISMSGNDFMMGAKAKALAGSDDFFKPFADKHYRGNMNTTIIRTHTGRTLMIQHDVTSPNIYSRIHKISGTKGSALKYPLPGRISISSEDEWLPEEKIESLKQKYQPDIVNKVGELAKQVGGHGGMDFLMDWRTIDCLRNGIPLDEDVYDAALWSVISPLSEWSVANKSKAINIPDFTRGAWSTNKPVDLTISHKNLTAVRHTEG